MKSKIYITGAAGFIGFHAAKKFLDKGIKVHGFDALDNYYDVNLKKSRLNILKKYKKFSFTKGLLKNKKLLDNSILKFKPTIIIHLAAQAGVRYSLDNPDVYLNSNILGTFNVIKIANKIKVKHLIIGSSSSVYGANTKIPFQEIDKTDHQISFYAATKKSTESLAHSYSSLWKLPITMLRFFTVYGPYGRPDMAYFKFTKNILEGKKIDIYNKGMMYRDYTYIDDIVDGIYKLLNKVPSRNLKNIFKNDSLSAVAPFRILNIGNTKKIYLLDFINTLEKELKKKVKKNFMPMQKGDVLSTLSDSSLLKRITGYNPKTNYKDGIKNFINWYLEYYN
ncbi:GDP-mannose 4,6-dehydratase [Candidatus Pelagibacter sp.]|nr:GDP-mannose 4,6-dehydratase [Candidatus Pelagibacter sp.]